MKFKSCCWGSQGCKKNIRVAVPTFAPHPRPLGISVTDLEEKSQPVARKHSPKRQNRRNVIASLGQIQVSSCIIRAPPYFTTAFLGWSTGLDLCVGCHAPLPFKLGSM